MVIRRLTMAVATAISLLLVAFVPLVASANPTVFCTKTASGTVDKYTFPTDCSGSAFPTGYHTMYLDILGQCSSTSDSIEYVGMNFNGVGNTNSEGYSYQGSAFVGRSSSSGLFPAVVGHVPCPGSSGIASKFAGSLGIKVLLGQNTDFYSINWLSMNAYEQPNAGNTGSDEETQSWSGSWWNFNPNGPPMSSVTIRTGSNWKLGSQFTVYFE